MEDQNLSMIERLRRRNQNINNNQQNNTYEHQNTYENEEYNHQTNNNQFSDEYNSTQFSTSNTENINDFENDFNTNYDDNCKNDFKNEFKNEQKEEKEENQKEDVENKFQCSICLDTCQNPVVTQCGHMYCWECLREWLDHQKTCPMCHSQVSEENVIPIYTGTDSTDPRTAPRPQGHYTPPPEQPRQQRNPFMFNGANFMFGFGLPGMMMNFGNMNLFGGNMNNNGEQRELTEEERRQRKKQKYLMLIIILLPIILNIIRFLFWPSVIYY